MCKLALKWSEKLVFFRGNFFFTCVNLTSVSVFLLFSAFKMINICFGWAYLQLREFLIGQLQLFVNLTISVVINY